jgi:hypothetical protein
MATGSPIYLQAVHDLAAQISTHLKALKAEIPAGPEGKSTRTVRRHPNLDRTVFLAESTSDVGEMREDVRRTLEQFGVTVLPARVYPRDGADFTAAVDADLTRADLFVQLLGDTPAERSADLPQGYDALQAEKAAARRVPLLRWVSPELDLAHVEDQAHAELLAGPEVMQIPLTAFKAEIIRRIRGPAPVAPTVAAEELVFINADIGDLSAAEVLGSDFRQANFVAAMPVRHGTAEQVRVDLEEKLLACDALVLVHGESSPAWLYNQLRLYSKLRHRRRHRLRGLAVFGGPPDLNLKIQTNFPDCRQITAGAGRAQSVQQFVLGLYQ